MLRVKYEDIQESPVQLQERVTDKIAGRKLVLVWSFFRRSRGKMKDQDDSESRSWLSWRR